MSVLQEAFTGIFAALATSLLVVGAIALAITEGVVVPEANENPATPTAEPSDSGFPGFSTSTVRPTARALTRRPGAGLVVVTTQPAASTCPAVPDWERYTTLPGDSLPALASARGVTAEQLMDANCLVSSILQPGWQLFLPRLAPTATSQPLTPTVTLTSSPTTRTCGPPTGWVRYTVRSGDTLTRISTIYSVSISDLQRANCMGASIFIRTGKSLYVPNVSPRYTATPTPQPPPPTTQPPPPTSIPPTVPAPALTLAKTANPMNYDATNQTVTYTYVLRNTGNVALDAPFAVSDDKTSVTCPSTPVTLAQNAAITCTATYAITQADLDAGSVTNQATATGKFGNQTILSKKAAITILARQKPALTLAKIANPVTYNAKDQAITYTITLLNSGNVTLSALFAVTDDHAPVTCPSPPAVLAPKSSYTCIATYKITQVDLDAGSVTNQATATGKFGNLTIAATPATAKVTAVQTPSLLLTKSGTLPASPISAGNIINYSYELNNTGNVTLNGPFTVSDNKTTVSCQAMPTTLAPTTSLKCSAAYTIVADDITAGSVTNIATAHAVFNGNPLDSNQATTTLTVGADVQPDRTTTASNFALRHLYPHFPPDPLYKNFD